MNMIFRRNLLGHHVQSRALIVSAARTFLPRYNKNACEKQETDVSIKIFDYCFNFQYCPIGKQKFTSSIIWKTCDCIVLS